MNEDKDDEGTVNCSDKTNCGFLKLKLWTSALAPVKSDPISPLSSSNHENLIQIVLHVGADNELFLSQQNLLNFLH